MKKNLRFEIVSFLILPAVLIVISSANFSVAAVPLPEKLSTGQMPEAEVPDGTASGPGAVFRTAQTSTDFLAGLSPLSQSSESQRGESGQKDSQPEWSIQGVGTAEIEVVGTPYDPLQHTVLSGRPNVLARGGSNDPWSPNIAGVLLNENDPTKFSFVYDLWPDRSVYAEALIQWDNGVGRGNLPEGFVLGLKGPDGAIIRVEIVDGTGRTAVFCLRLAGDYRNYSMVLSGGNVPDSFDRGDIAAVRFYLDRELTGFNWRGEIEVSSGVPVVRGTAYDESAHTVLDDRPVLGWQGGNKNPANLFAGGILMTQSSSRAARFEYDLWPHSDSFVTASARWSPQAEGFTGPWVLGLKGPEGARMIADVYDRNGRAARFRLELTGDFLNYALDFSSDAAPAGFDPSQISHVQFYIDRELSNYQYRGAVEIRTAGLYYLPAVFGTAFDSGQLTPLGNSRTVGVSGGHYQSGNPLHGGVILNQESPASYSFQYDLWPDSGAYVGNTIDLEQDAVHGYPPLPGALVLGLNGPMGTWLKIEIEDAGGKTAEYRAQMVNQLRNYFFDLTGDNVPPGFDMGEIRRVRITLDRALAAWNLRGTIGVKISDVPIIYPSGLTIQGVQAIPAPVIASAGFDPRAGYPAYHFTGSILDSSESSGECDEDSASDCPAE